MNSLFNFTFVAFTDRYFTNKMKTILVPTDYSETALNAAEYAIEIAKIMKAKIILLHIFDVPVAVTDIPVTITTYEDYEKIKKEQLKKYESELLAKYGKSVSISSILKPGYVNDEIKDTVIEKKITLIVMGITGAGRLPELLIGSNVSRVIKNIDCPTITIHENIKFRPIKKVALATDYDEVEESNAFEKVIDFIKLFRAKLVLINVIDPAEKVSYKKELSGALLEHIFDEIDHTISFRKNEDVVDGINNFVDRHHIDMLVMLPKKHSLFFRLFHESNTKKMAFHTHVPLLTIHN